MPPIIPRATYRVQLTSDFGFEAAAAIVPYLQAVGISHLYCSPFTQARPGSVHGYDVIDHNTLSTDLGGESGFERLSDELEKHDMGLILDFVPNHMAASPANPWWKDVLNEGQSSEYADYFDIDWSRPLGFRHAVVTLPILGKSYGQVLADGELRLEHDGKAWSVAYFDRRFPVSTAGEIFIQRHGAPIIDGNPALMHRLLRLQHYRLMYWRNAASQINYRRFFDINDLVGLRVEEPRVFSEIHKLIRRLVKAGRLHGIRLDHIDGLRNPAAYCAQLTDLLGKTTSTPIYLVVEKILAANERLPQFSGVSGTTGYEWTNLLTRCFVNEPGLRILNRFWRDVCPPPETSARSAKALILAELFPRELKTLVAQLHRVALSHWESSDLSPYDLGHALRAYISALPVYRTYVSDAPPTESDLAVIEASIATAREGEPSIDGSVFDFLKEALTLRLADRRGYSRRRIRNFVGRLQQFTGPIMAKSIEDTLFYRDVRLLALNEVGGEPTAVALSPRDFHHRMAVRQETVPHGLTATATHDTKRGEDARLRIAALSDMSENWTAAVRRWLANNDPYRQQSAPTRAHEYLIYQSLIGAWDLAGITPEFVSRIRAYCVKAARESKTVTSWLHPDEAYEALLETFVVELLDTRQSSMFISEFEPLVRRASLLGALYSLGQVTLKATLPGVPDFYQGSELWDLSLVDPDNRRPVDYAARETALRTIGDRPDWHSLSRAWQNGAIKLALTHKLLELRRTHPDLFEVGTYAEIAVRDDATTGVLAFTRSHQSSSVVVAICTRCAPQSRGGREWPDFTKMAGTISLPDGQTFRNALADAAEKRQFSGEVALKDVFGPLPLAVFLRA